MKHIVEIPEEIGHLGHTEGEMFRNRIELSQSGLHNLVQSGIWRAGTKYAVSVVVSGGYVDDEDNGDSILYTGQGGRDPKTRSQISDQQLTRGNLGLYNSMEDSLPVRVIRGFQVKHGPVEGYRYDGLYFVQRAFQEASIDGPLIWRFELTKPDVEEYSSPSLTSRDSHIKSSLFSDKRFSKINLWKSCPKCSKINSAEREYKLLLQKNEEGVWDYNASDYGFTVKRETKSNPLGAQSLCKICRSGSHLAGLVASNIHGEVICSGSWEEISEFL